MPPAPWNERFDPDYAGTITGENFLTDPAISVAKQTPLDPDARRRAAPDRDLEHLLALYDAEIAWTDHRVGRIIERLRETGELDRTLVVVTSDHGDEFFEHGDLGHRRNLFEESVRIPLIVRYPPAVQAGLEPAPVVSLSDLREIVLDLIGLPESNTPTPTRTAPRFDLDERADATSWMGRIVKIHPASAPSGLRGRLTLVGEAFLQWPIKIVRWRRWTDPLDGPAPNALRRAAPRRGISRTGTGTRFPTGLDRSRSAPRRTATRLL